MHLITFIAVCVPELVGIGDGVFLLIKCLTQPKYSLAHAHHLRTTEVALAAVYNVTVMSRSSYQHMSKDCSADTSV